MLISVDHHRNLLNGITRTAKTETETLKKQLANGDADADGEGDGDVLCLNRLHSCNLLAAAISWPHFRFWAAEGFGKLAPRQLQCQLSIKIMALRPKADVMPAGGLNSRVGT